MNATLTLQRSQLNFPWKLAGILVLLATAVILGMHAVEKHGSEAEAVRSCMSRQGPTQVWSKPDGRQIWVCIMPDGKFGLQVNWTDEAGKVHEITSFIKSKFQRWSQLYQYLKNCGATRVYP